MQPVTYKCDRQFSFLITDIFLYIFFMKIAYFGYKKESYAPKTIIDFCKKNGHKVTFFNVDDLIFCNGILTKNLLPIVLDDFDTAIVRSHGRVIDHTYEENFVFTYHINKLLHDRSIPTINGTFFNHNPFFDKFSQSLFFAKKNIPTIPTIHSISPSKLQKKHMPWDFPLILKEINGSFGLSVHKINTYTDLAMWIKKNPRAQIILQKFIPATCDYRVIVCGKKAIGIMKRSSASDGWKHNFSQDATIEACFDERMSTFAEHVAQELQCDFVGVDIIIDQKGNYLVVEINLSANFKGFEKIHGKYLVGKNLIETLAQNKLY